MKLLWECCHFIHLRIKEVCKRQKIKRPRYKYSDQKKKYKLFQKHRKKSHKMIKQRHRSLIYLLVKINNILIDLRSDLVFKKGHEIKLKTIKKIIDKQRYRYTDKIKFDEVKGRVVSLNKPYLRPIVRGKETKRVEFGAKVHIPTKLTRVFRWKVTTQSQVKKVV